MVAGTMSAHPTPESAQARKPRSNRPVSDKAIANADGATT
jgi:hypothetical protein